MTKPLSYETLLDRQDAARERREAKAYDAAYAREDKAEALIGKLIREGRPVLYINILDRQGRPTGKTREGSRHDLIAYLIRNRYV